MSEKAAATVRHMGRQRSRQAALHRNLQSGDAADAIEAQRASAPRDQHGRSGRHWPRGHPESGRRDGRAAATRPRWSWSATRRDARDRTPFAWRARAATLAAGRRAGAPGGRTGGAGDQPARRFRAQARSAERRRRRRGLSLHSRRGADGDGGRGRRAGDRADQQGMAATARAIAFPAIPRCWPN